MASAPVGPPRNRSAGFISAILALTATILFCLGAYVLFPRGGGAAPTPTPGGPLPPPELTWTPLLPTQVPLPTLTPAPPPPTATPPPPAPPTATAPPAPIIGSGLPPECFPIFLHHASIGTGATLIQLYPPGGGVEPGMYLNLSWAMQGAQQHLQVPLDLKPTLQGKGLKGQPYYGFPLDPNRALYLRGALYIGDRQARALSVDGICWDGGQWKRVPIPQTGVPDPVVGK
jgi:hypothetical protein